MSIFSKKKKKIQNNAAFRNLTCSCSQKKHDKATIYIIPLDGAVTETPCRPA
jgi:hypothetical protein